MGLSTAEADWEGMVASFATAKAISPQEAAAALAEMRDSSPVAYAITCASLGFEPLWGGF